MKTHLFDWREKLNKVQYSVISLSKQSVAREHVAALCSSITTDDCNDDDDDDEDERVVLLKIQKHTG